MLWLFYVLFWQLNSILYHKIQNLITLQTNSNSPMVFFNHYISPSTIHEFISKLKITITRLNLIRTKFIYFQIKTSTLICDQDGLIKLHFFSLFTTLILSLSLFNLYITSIISRMNKDQTVTAASQVPYVYNIVIPIASPLKKKNPVSPGSKIA